MVCFAKLVYFPLHGWFFLFDQSDLRGLKNGLIGEQFQIAQGERWRNMEKHSENILWEMSIKIATPMVAMCVWSWLALLKQHHMLYNLIQRQLKLQPKHRRVTRLFPSLLQYTPPCLHTLPIPSLLKFRLQMVVKLRRGEHMLSPRNMYQIKCLKVCAIHIFDTHELLQI